jgi:hypothetical protein
MPVIIDYSKKGKGRLVRACFFIFLVVSGSYLVLRMDTVNLILSGDDLDYEWRLHSFGPVIFIFGLFNSVREIYLFTKEKHIEDN